MTSPFTSFPVHTVENQRRQTRHLELELLSYLSFFIRDSKRRDDGLHALRVEFLADTAGVLKCPHAVAPSPEDVLVPGREAGV